MMKLLIASGGKTNNPKLINQTLAVDHNSCSDVKEKINKKRWIQLAKSINNKCFRKSPLIPQNRNVQMYLKNQNFLMDCNYNKQGTPLFPSGGILTLCSLQDEFKNTFLSCSLHGTICNYK